MATSEICGGVRVRRAAAADIPQFPELCNQLGYPSSEEEVRARFGGIDAAADHGIAGAIVRDHGAALLRRIQFSYRPKQIALVEPGIPELAETLRQTGLDVLGNTAGGARQAAV